MSYMTPLLHGPGQSKCWAVAQLHNECLAALQGLPEGHTEACYPVLRPGVDSHRAPPLKDSDADKREVRRRQAELLRSDVVQA